jgi:hypothetical protein
MHLSTSVFGTPTFNRTCCKILSASSVVQFWPSHAAYLGRQSTSRDVQNVCQLAWARRRHMGLRWRLCAGALLIRVHPLSSVSTFVILS